MNDENKNGKAIFKSQEHANFMMAMDQIVLALQNTCTEYLLVFRNSTPKIGESRAVLRGEQLPLVLARQMQDPAFRYTILATLDAQWTHPVERKAEDPPKAPEPSAPDPEAPTEE